jgi:membrane protease YdiL (CAAX protease family)
MHRPILTGLRRSLWEKTPRDHRDTPGALRRRQVVCVLTVLVGGLILAATLRIEPGSPWFYPATAGLAVVWTVGAFASGHLHLGTIATEDRLSRPILQPLAIGLGLAAVFLAGGAVVRLIPPLAEQVRVVLAHANEGLTPVLVLITLLNGIAEELFFRGAAYAAITQHPVAWTTLAYAVTTAATGNVMLAFAAAVLGVVVGLERRASGGILAPAITHIAWSLPMLVLLPLVVGVA